MARDSLRATLDELKVDETAANDRPYLEAMLRRLGYTEKEIREELGPPVEAEPLPEVAPTQDLGADDGVAPARDYRLVVPARESAFTYEDPDAARGPDSPFEAFERVEFEETQPEEETVEFTEEPAPQEALQEAPVQEAGEFQVADVNEYQELPVEELAAEETPPAEDVSVDTFGGPQVDTAPRTRVRVKRVRAKSKAEAEAKVASANRRVIKSIPVDIVERWGPGDKGDKGARK